MAERSQQLGVEQLVQQLQLAAHPEGGFYRETFRDERTVEGGRAATTAILYLLPTGAKSKLHRLDASECWHAYLGGPITVVQLDASAPGQVRLTVVGPDLAAGHQLQHVVPANTWFGAVPGDATQEGGAAQWALVGCTVAPGFEFSAFEFGDRARLLAEFPKAAPWIERLMAD
ncbi:hypothetical protein ABPG75_009456 [Micractinium tetrahymenae]